MKSIQKVQCSPSLVAVGIMFIGVVWVYVYRKTILEILLWSAFVIACVGAAILVAVIIVIIIRWHRERATERHADIKAKIAHLGPAFGQDEATGMLDSKSDGVISAEADWLSDTAVELAWSPDGKTLKAKKD